MKTTIELTASAYLSETITNLLGATNNLLEVAKLLQNSKDLENNASNILTDQLNEACNKLGSCKEKCSTKKLTAGNTTDEGTAENKDEETREESEAPIDTDTLDIQTIRVLAKEKCVTAGREAVKSLITNLGVDHLEALEESKYQELFNQLQAL